MEDCVREVKKRPGLSKRSIGTDSLFDEEPDTDEDKLWVSRENLLEAATSKEKTGRPTGIFRKSRQPAHRSIATEDPLSNTNDLSSSWDSLSDAEEGDLSAYSDLSASKNNVWDATNVTQDNKAFDGTFRGMAKTKEQVNENTEEVEVEPRPRSTIKERRHVVSFRVKKTLSKIPDVTLSTQRSEKIPVIEDDVELCELNPEQESDKLMEWWDTVKGWRDWNETLKIQEEDEEMIVEQAADRVYLGARLFVHLFNQRGATLQRRILELLSVADAADHFHKKTVRAAVGGGVASVAGSLATITGLILAPFTFGASVIVTAVGISVATAGGITSATANITDTVHSSMDRKKVEKMIQGYQEEIKDIRECLEFVQEGMDVLQVWNFEQYSESAAQKALNHSVKTVVRAGGSAGRALIVNTEKLISTVQILGATGSAVKAAKVISVTTGVMTTLFLALDVFFLAKDSHELRKGAKTQFAAKIREVCKDLQHGLLELNKVKTQLQKTMDGIEVEEYEEILEVEVEIGDDWKQDPKELEEELEQELDLLEEKLDRKVGQEEKKSKEVEGKLKSKSVAIPDTEKEKKTEKSIQATVEILEYDWKNNTQEPHTQSQPRTDMALHDGQREINNKQRNEDDNVRRQVERKGGEEETRPRRQDGEDQVKDKGLKQELRGYRPRSNALMEDAFSLN